MGKYDFLCLKKLSYRRLLTFHKTQRDLECENNGMRVEK